MTQRMSILYPRPSDIRWMESEAKVSQTFRDEYFDLLVKVLLRNNTTIELIDTVWTSGIESRNIFQTLSPAQKTAIDCLNTVTAKVWMNGIHGNTYDEGLTADD